MTLAARFLFLLGNRRLFLSHLNFSKSSFLGTFILIFNFNPPYKYLKTSFWFVLKRTMFFLTEVRMRYLFKICLSD